MGARGVVGVVGVFGIVGGLVAGGCAGDEGAGVDVDAATDGASAGADGAGADGAGTDGAGADDVAEAPLCSASGAAEVWTIEGLAADGPWLAGYVDLVMTDTSRPTAAHGALPEITSRTLSARVYYPAVEGPLGALTPALLAPLARADGPFPLLVHSHGFSSNQDELSYAARWMATRGWVVALVEFPLTRLGTAGGPLFADVVNQPEDVSFVIDQLLAHAALALDPLEGGIDAERVALSGVSLGGLTTLLATYHRDLHDARVKAAVDFAGPTGFFSQAFYGFVDVPSLLVYGDTDAIVDYAAHALPARARAPAGTRLVTLAGASHTAFANAAALFEELDNPDSVGCGAIEGDLSGSASLLSELADAEIGIEDVTLPTPCALDPLPRAMRPSRQHLIVRVTLYAWLELQLGDEPATRGAACRFLSDTLPAEPDVDLE